MVNRSDKLLGRYELGEVIGAGGMGTVTRAHDSVLGREVAIKFLRDDFASDPVTLERFRREARIAAALSHPGIAQVYDFAEEDGRSFIVMELLDGRDLHQVLSQDGPLDPVLAASIVAHAADALNAAHHAGSVHRDVKPANIFITQGGSVKVTDFGVAKAASSSSVTTAGTLIGTPFYLSPEQVDGHAATPRSDVYALGCVLFQLLSGAPPYEGDSSVAVAMSHLSAPIPHIRSVRPGIPEAIDEVIRKALAKDPSERFDSASSFATALRAAAGITDGSVDLGSTASLSGVTTVIPVAAAASTQVVEIPGRARGKRRALFAVLAAALALLLLAALIGSMGKRATDNKVAVADVVGLTFDQASSQLKAAGFVVDRKDVLSNKAAGTVVAQDPAARTLLIKGGTVTLSISASTMVSVPKVTDLTLDQAKSALSGQGLSADVAIPTNIPDGAILIVVAQEPPAGASVAKGSAVRLTIEIVQRPTRHGKHGKGD